MSQPNFDMSAREKWLQKFDQLLLKIITAWLSKHCYYNIKDFKIDILSRYEMKNIIEKPTRNGATLIDHIITKIKRKISDQDVLPCPTIRDHYARFITLGTKVARYEPRYKIVRSYKNFDMEKYVIDLSTLPFSRIMILEDPNDQ